METITAPRRRPRGPRPVTWLREHAFAADLILAVAVTAISIIFHLAEVESDGMVSTDPSWWTVPLVIAAVFPVLWRRRHPVAATVVVVVAQIICSFADIAGPEFIGVLIALYSIGAHAAGRRRTKIVVALAAGIGVLFIAGLVVDELNLGAFVSSVVFLVTAFVLGDNLRRRREAAQSLADRLERAEREQELIAQQHVSAERTRIARELHDVVAHSVSVMVIQAGAARRNLTSSPDTAEQALANIEQTGRQTMTELRAVLGVLRRNIEPTTGVDGEQVALDPQPTLAEVQHLVDSSSDLPVDLTVTGRLDDITASVDLAGYRIVQEALTNVRRHGGPVTSVVVRIERHDAHLSVSITDDGRGGAADDTGPGYGVIGMSERVEAVGGTLTAGVRPGGGWQVTAILPAPPLGDDAAVADDPIRAEVSS